jgi:hypothetical protein
MTLSNRLLLLTSKVSVTLDLNILVMIANAEGTATAKDKTEPEQLPTATLQLLSPRDAI